MNRDTWIGERAKLLSILQDIESGLIKLAKGQDEYLETLKRRIAHLDDKIVAEGSDRVVFNIPRSDCASPASQAL